MQVQFQRTGERRYAVIILRDNLPLLKMNPAPGFDPLMPHDLLHLLVEKELNLRQGIFGQIAHGGTAGTFQQEAADNASAKDNSRQRRKIVKRGKKLLNDNLDECAQSERATYICLYEWMAHSSDKILQERTKEMKKSVDSVLVQMPEKERAILMKKLPEIKKRMDQLSRQWSALKINEVLSIEF